MYVNLLENVEANTGYVGDAASKIWEAIYNENCLFEIDTSECIQNLVFFRLVSGLHTSISTHLAVKFKRLPDGSYLPNQTELERRVLSHPSRINNLHFLFRFVLQATIVMREGFLTDMSKYNSGLKDQDNLLKDALTELYDDQFLNGRADDAGMNWRNDLFHNDELAQYLENAGITHQVKKFMQNVTTLMNCLECEKCRLWGKCRPPG